MIRTDGNPTIAWHDYDDEIAYRQYDVADDTVVITIINPDIFEQPERDEEPTPADKSYFVTLKVTIPGEHLKSVLPPDQWNWDGIINNPTSSSYDTDVEHILTTPIP